MVHAEKMPQTQKVFNYLRTHGGMTSRDAFLLGISYLPARINDLRKAGHEIEDEMISIYDEEGKYLCNCKVYSLKEEEK